MVHPRFNTTTVLLPLSMDKNLCLYGEPSAQWPPPPNLVKSGGKAARGDGAWRGWGQEGFLMQHTSHVEPEGIPGSGLGASSPTITLLICKSSQWQTCVQKGDHRPAVCLRFRHHCGQSTPGLSKAPRWTEGSHRTLLPCPSAGRFSSPSRTWTSEQLAKGTEAMEKESSILTRR